MVSYRLTIYLFTECFSAPVQNEFSEEKRRLYCVSFIFSNQILESVISYFF